MQLTVCDRILTHTPTRIERASVQRVVISCFVRSMQARCSPGFVHLQMLHENEQLRAQNAALSSDEPAAEYGALLEAAEAENLELQSQLQRAQEMNKGLTAALHAAQTAGTQLQAANSELLEQLQSLGVQPRVPSPSQMELQDLVSRSQL